MRTQSNYGSVAVREVPTVYGDVYVPSYFGNHQKEPKHTRREGHTIFAIEGVDAIMHGSRIWNLCYQASRTPTHKPEISKEALKRGLSKLLTN